MQAEAEQIHGVPESAVRWVEQQFSHETPEHRQSVVRIFLRLLRKSFEHRQEKRDEEKGTGTSPPVE